MSREGRKRQITWCVKPKGKSQEGTPVRKTTGFQGFEKMAFKNFEKNPIMEDAKGKNHIRLEMMTEPNLMKERERKSIQYREKVIPKNFFNHLIRTQIKCIMMMICQKDFPCLKKSISHLRYLKKQRMLSLNPVQIRNPPSKTNSPVLTPRPSGPGASS